MNTDLNHAWWLAVAILLFGFANVNGQERKVIVVVGAEGTPEYGEQFDQWASAWENTVQSNQSDDSNLTLTRIGSDSGDEKTDFERFQAAVESTSKTTEELWIVLIGHGTDDRKNSKFNLRGPDVTAKQVNQWLTPLPCRCVVINCASASGSWISKLKADNRIVITATRSAAQHNFARFGQYLAGAIADPAFDLDKDQQTSLLEGFVAASSQAQEFYLQDKRLATELAMIDDNSDGRGTPANWFEGTRVVRKSKSGEPDGFTANQFFLVRRGVESRLSGDLRKKRDDLEANLEKIRSRRKSYDEDGYYLAIEPILLELGAIYASVEEEDAGSSSPSDNGKLRNR